LMNDSKEAVLFIRKKIFLILFHGIFIENKKLIVQRCMQL
ncbi:hypothetical protein T12_2950, partial [Trichinella patagoniensis]